MRKQGGGVLWVKMLELSLYFCLFVVSNKKNTFKAKGGTYFLTPTHVKNASSPLKKPHSAFSSDVFLITCIQCEVHTTLIPGVTKSSKKPARRQLTPPLFCLARSEESRLAVRGITERGGDQSCRKSLSQSMWSLSCFWSYLERNSMWWDEE